MLHHHQVLESGPVGGKIAIVMAPMMWDDGTFCAPLTELLLDCGYRVSIYDTMSVAQDCADLLSTAVRWGAILRTRHTRIDLAVGQAYGGALVQYLLADTLANCPRVIGISAPNYYDDALRAGLSGILDTLMHMGPAAALSETDWMVQANHSSPSQPTDPVAVPPDTARRLQAGLTHLCAVDAREQVASFAGRILWLYGEASRLVRGCNIIPIVRKPLQNAIALPHCGMRPLADAREEAMALIRDFLEETSQ
jgi:pimeloyl-ACP methyl ester carboxylesterase